MGYIDNTMMFGTPKAPAPCIKCEARHTACHDSCVPYKEWSTEVRAKKTWLDKTTTRLQRFGDYYEV